MAIGKTNAGAGGSGGVNFRVVSGTTQPTSPKENTIWVNTNTAISGYTISGIATPGWAMSAGWVYINAKIGRASGPPEFNALKKNEILIKPDSVKQYVDGKWVDKEAKIYQGGQWVDWIKYLYDHGDSCVGLGGEWVATGLAYESDDKNNVIPTITRNPTSMDIDQTERHGGAVYKRDKIDLTDVTTMTLHVTNRNSTLRPTYRRFVVWTELGSYWTSNVAAVVYLAQEAGEETVTLDVAHLSGEYCVGITVYDAQTTVHYLRLD